jgi:preprotein translocase subunit SecY
VTGAIVAGLMVLLVIVVFVVYVFRKKRLIIIRYGIRCEMK